jgi:hypothetical protein
MTLLFETLTSVMTWRNVLLQRKYISNFLVMYFHADLSFTPTWLYIANISRIIMNYQLASVAVDGYDTNVVFIFGPWS